MRRSPRREKRRRSLERYAPVARRRRSSSSVSAPEEKRQRTAEPDDVSMKSPLSGDKKAEDSEVSRRDLMFPELLCPCFSRMLR